MHWRLSFAPALPRRLALRQRSAQIDCRSYARVGRRKRSAFSAGNDSWLAALSVSCPQPVAAQAAGANGSASFISTSLSNSKTPRGRSGIEIAQRRYHRDNFTRSQWTLLNCACWSGPARKRRRSAFHARVVPGQFRKSRGGRAVIEISLSIRQRQRDPRSEEHTSELQSRRDLVCRLLLEKKNNKGHSSIFIRQGR